ncbi:hypothetical protein AB0F88_33550 [Streptosporangium sp. NPDC023963]|uniref:hypothetical protein n=1 Tax=Streptosporangium sp. NPDC023963 TaxID=3155608 RepID=UPI0034431A86
MRLAIRIAVAAVLTAGPSSPAGPAAPPPPPPGPARAPATTAPGRAPAATVDVDATPTPAVAPGATPTPMAAPGATPTPTPMATSTPVASAGSGATATATLSTRTDHTVSLPPFGGRNTIPPWLKKVPSLRVLPLWPRQAGHVRIFVHCPPKSNHALIGSTAFNLKGSRRLYREVGLGLSDRGLGHRAASISYFALPGFHEACLKCVKVTMNQQTRIRRIRVLGRDSTPLYVRRFSIWQFFD